MKCFKTYDVNYNTAVFQYENRITVYMLTKGKIVKQAVPNAKRGR